jgi:ketosteroid isomerase-like protein
MDDSDIRSWVDRYIGAWSSNDPAEIGGLFTEDARYFTAPFRDPWSGRETIVKEWLDRKDAEGDWTFRYEILAMAGDLGFVRGWTEYGDGTAYSNLWVVRLDGRGRATEFTEWWMEES